ncbi:MAG TPA: tyrosine-protein phosphatase [Luteolibacter sp.]|nr:tyrosine-protein phosphatase [Luteolibacter sp.]
MISLRWIAAMMVAGALVSCAEPYGLQRVDHKVWRSSQPEKEQVAEMEEAGIKEVLNLRSYHSDDELAGHLKCHHVRMDAGNLNDESMFEALSILVNAKEPIVVHCWHGADRTGAVVALYRMVVHRWPRKMAIDEMMKPEFGHHADTFPNVRGYLENVDIVAMRRRLNLSGIDSGPAGIRNPLSPAAR